MPKIKTKKKPEAIVLPISEWGVSNYGVTLYVNNHSLRYGMKEGVSLDVEDDEQGGFVGLGIYDPAMKTCFYWSEFALVKDLTLPRFIAHNGVSDITKLQKWGFKIDESWLIWDTMLMSHILDSSRRKYGLKTLANADLDIDYPSYELLTGNKRGADHITLRELPLELVAEYNACDTYSTYKLYEKQLEQTKDNLTEDTGRSIPYTYFEDIERPVSFVFQRMEERGLRIDRPYLLELKRTLEIQHTILEQQIKTELGEINLNSPKQLLEALHAEGIKPEIKRGKPSTDKRALERFKDLPTVQRLLQFSEVDTLLSSFVNPYLERNTEVVHPNFSQCGTRTGRPSCYNPNLLQIPRRTENGKLVRRMFIPREGMGFGDCDFGQIEPRLLAHLSKAPSLCEMFNKGIDFHTWTAERLSIDREKAKILNLSVGYRATKFSVSAQLKCSYETAQKEIDKWWSLYPDLWDWEQRLIYQAKQDGYFTTLMGRRIKVEDLNHGNEWRRSGAERQLINNIAQGSAAEVMKLAMIKADRIGIGLLVQVYDELLFEEVLDDLENATRIVMDCMETAIRLEVPLVCEAKTGTSWADGH